MHNDPVTGSRSIVPWSGTSALLTIALIREMAAANRLWGAERIRGELVKLNTRVANWRTRFHCGMPPAAELGTRVYVQSQCCV